MKKCPYCSEMIQDQTVKCRFCNEWLNVKRQRSKTQSLITQIIISTVLYVLIFFILAIGLVFVVPQFESIYASLGSKLPLYTRLFIELSAFIRGNFYLVLITALIFIGVYSYGMYWITKKDKKNHEKYRLIFMIKNILFGILILFIIAGLIVVTYLPIFNLGEALTS